MPFDALTLHSVRDELAERIIGGYVERIVPSGTHEVALQLYCRPGARTLLVSAEPQRERVCLVQRTPHRLDVPDSPFLLLLRKHVRGSVLRRIEQPYLERILRLDFEQRQDDEVSSVSLIIEVMGRRSNALLVDADGVILDALKRVPPARNPNRPLLPHLAYVNPPPQTGTLDPRDPRLAERLAERALLASVPTLAQLLGGNLAGFSPLACREVAFRATGSASTPLAAVHDWLAVAAAVWAITEGLERHVWSPCVALRDGQVVQFAPYLLTHLADAHIEPVASPSEAVERAFAPAETAASLATASAAPLLQAVEARRCSVERRLGALRQAQAALPDPAALLEAGNALLASLSTLRPGQTAFSFNGVEYPLDPAVPPLEQAKRLFKEYQKARDASRTLPRLIQTAELELAHLADLRTLVEVSRTPEQLRGLRAELAAAGLLGAEEQRKQERRARKQQAAAARPRRLELDGFEVFVGTSAQTNELITFRIARPDDIWLHAHGVPGAHVVIRTGGRTPPPALLERAAQLAAAASAAHSASRVEVDWTERRYVRKVPGGPPGLVTYTQQQSLLVPPAPELPV